MEEYLKEYVILIELSKYRGINKKVLTGYYEKHHIIPKCVGGEDKPNSLNIGVTTLKRWILNKPEKGFRYL